MCQRSKKEVTYRLMWTKKTAATPLCQFAAKGKMNVRGVADQEK
jgi:hypothetical protein